MIETPKEFVEKIIDECYSSHMNANDLLCIHIATRDAAIRAECAERAIAWCDSWNGYQILQPESGDTLRAAIMAEL